MKTLLWLLYKFILIVGELLKFYQESYNFFKFMDLRQWSAFDWYFFMFASSIQ